MDTASTNLQPHENSFVELETPTWVSIHLVPIRLTNKSHEVTKCTFRNNHTCFETGCFDSIVGEWYVEYQIDIHAFTLNITFSKILQNMILSLVNRLPGETVVTSWRKASNMTEAPSPLINNLCWPTSNYLSTDVMKWVIMLDLSCYAKYAQFSFDKVMLELYCLPQADIIF